MMKLLRSVSYLFLLLGFTFSQAFGQTGKITGTVTDAETGESLPGVNVVIVGTAMGATTNANGTYTILNIAPGSYDVRASFVGYARQIVEGVEVSIDLTTTVDFELQEEAVGLEEVVVQSEEPVIQRDVSGSQRNINPEEIEAGRYQELRNVINAQVSTNATDVYEVRPEIRGSDVKESMILVDGVSQGNAFSNRPHYEVNLDAVKQVKVETGGFNAEYGNVRSGIINVVTREGGQNYSGSVNVQYSPPALKHFGPNHFNWDSPYSAPFVKEELGAFSGEDNPVGWEGWNSWANSTLEPGDPHYGKPMEGYARWLWRHRSEDSIEELRRLEDEGIVEFAPDLDLSGTPYHSEGVLPDYRISTTLGGPVPGVPVNFFLSYNREQTEYINRHPLRAYGDHNARAKFTVNPASNMKLNLHGYFSTKQGGNNSQGAYTSGTGLRGWVANDPYGAIVSEYMFWYPHCACPAQQTRQIYGANWTHTLSSNTFYEVQLNHHRTDYDVSMDWRDTKPIPGSDGWTHLLDGFIGTSEQAEANAAEDPGWENWQDWRRIRIGDYWYDEAPAGYGPVNWKDVAGTTLESCAVHTNESFQRSYEMKASVTSQVNSHNQIKTGLHVRMDHLNMYRTQIDPSVGGGNVWKSQDKRQFTGALYVQDKLEFEGLVANLGLRADGIVKGKFPLLAGSEDDKENGPYSNVLLAGNSGSEEGRMGGNIEELLTQERVHQVRLSPRLGISHPISTVAKIFFNYGHFYQWPDAWETYHTEYYTTLQNWVVSLGNPGLEPPRTIQYEMGYEHNLFDRIKLQLTTYYKDIRDEVGMANYYPTNGRSHGRPQNQGYSDVRGMELFAHLQRGSIPYVSIWGSFNYSVRSGAEFGYDQYYEDPTAQPSFADTEVSDPDVRPIAKVNIDFHTPEDFGPTVGDMPILGGLNLNLLYTWRRGRQFTWNPNGIPYVENNIRWRPYTRWDMRLRKTVFSLGGVESEFYIDVTNLFNFKNMEPVTSYIYNNDRNRVLTGATGTERSRWAWDGHPFWNNQFLDYMRSLDLEVQDDGTVVGPDRPGDYEGDHINMPAFSPGTFLEKRDIFFGMKIRF